MPSTLKKDVIVGHAATSLELFPQSQLTFEHRASARAEVDAAVFASLRAVAINPGDAGFAYAQRSVRRIEVRYDESAICSDSGSSVKKRNSS